MIVFWLLWVSVVVALILLIIYLVPLPDKTERTKLEREVLNIFKGKKITYHGKSFQVCDARCRDDVILLLCDKLKFYKWVLLSEVEINEKKSS